MARKLYEELKELARNTEDRENSKLYVSEKESGKYYLYINGAKYSETKTLKTAKKHVGEHFRESSKKVFA